MTDFELYEYSENKLKEARKRIAELEERVWRQKKKMVEKTKKISDLEKELKKWKDEWQEQVQKATDEGYARTLQTMQLSKAKEIIKNLMVYVPVDLKEYEEAKQFLKDSEGK